MLLTEQEMDDLSREMVKGCKSVNWLARTIEASIKERLKMQEPIAYMVQHDGKCMGFLPTSEKNTVPVFNHPDPRVAELKQQRDELLTVVQDMVQMMDSGDEHGAGSPWYTKAKAAIAKIEKILK